MTLNDIYRKKIPEGKDWFDKYAFMKNIMPPNSEEIAQYQIKQARKIFAPNPQLKEMIKKINLDMMQEIVDRDGEAVEKAIQCVENALGSWQTFNPYSASKIRTTISSDVLQGLEVDLNKYEKLLQNLQAVYSKMSTYKSNADIESRLVEIESAMNQIAADINNFKAGTFTPLGDLESNSRGYLAKAANIGHSLKGKYLELAATEWFANKIPSNIQVVNVGSVTGWSLDIFGGQKSKGKQLRTDVMGFDTDIAQQINVSYEIGGQRKTSTLKDLIDLMQTSNDRVSISLNNTNYDDIRKALVFGAQAKSGQGQSIFNKTTTTLAEVITHGDVRHYAKALQILIDIAANSKMGSSLITKSKEYDAMFNYLLGKHLANIIGRENYLVITRNGVQTVYEYMLDQWNKTKRMVQAIERRVDIEHPGKITKIGYSSQNQF